MSDVSSAAHNTSYASVHNKVAKNRRLLPPTSLGLSNLGNTCYMNTALQCLANTPALVEYFIGFPWREELNRDNPIGAGGRLAEEFGQLIGQMWEIENGATKTETGEETDISTITASNIKKRKRKKIIEPKSFKRTLGMFRSQFMNSRQQDVQELLAFLLDGLHEDLNRVVKKPYVEDVDPEGKTEDEIAVESWRRYLLRNRSIVVDLFQGQLRNVLHCLTCNHSSTKFDPYMYMSVPCNHSTTSLRHCLMEFCRPEILSSDCQWRCPKCEEYRDAEKKMDLWIAPPIFIVHLKRFMTGRNGKKNTKIDSCIDFPINQLDLSDFIGKSNGSGSSHHHVYNLFGVANHHGTLARGHYTAFARQEHTHKWFKFDDSKIKEVPEADVVNSSAYVLFYCKEYKSAASTGGTSVEASSVAKEKSSVTVLPDDHRPAKLLTVDMIRRQSITIPHHWPHNAPSTACSTSFAMNPLDSFDENEDIDEEDFENMPQPTFLATSSTTESTVHAPEEQQHSAPERTGRVKRKYKKRKPPTPPPYIERSSRTRVPPSRFE